MNKSDFLTELQEIVNRPGASRPASTIVKNLDLAAVISKFITPREKGQFLPSEPTSEINGTNAGIDTISKSIIARIEDNENIFKLFPDIELAIQIIVSSILSPKDMIKSELIFRMKESQLPTTMVAEMLDVVRSELEANYSFKKDGPAILRDALFRSGSHVRAVMPESAVDQLINQRTGITTESMYSTDLFIPATTLEGDKDKLTHLGLLGDPHATVTPNGRRSLALESALNVGRSSLYNPKLYVAGVHDEKESEFGITMEAFKKLVAESVDVSDNYHFLKMPMLLEAACEQNVARLTKNQLQQKSAVFAMEEYHQFQAKEKAPPTTKELSGILYKSSNVAYTPFLNVPSSVNLKRRSVGRPLILTIPSEAAIPVHVPGDVTKHIGYFVPVDIDGNPVTIGSATSDSGQGLSSMMQMDKSGSSASALLTEKARRNIAGDSVVPLIDHMTDLYADLIEHDTLGRLAKGAYGKKLGLGRNNEIYRIMLARALKSQFTRLIYIPAEYVTYFAFNYHRNGVGKSYLDDLSNITSLRAMVVFSKVMAAVKSSISTTLVNVSLDPRDQDPVKTMELAKHFVARSRQQYFPHGLNRVADLTDWIHRAGVEITFDGHPRLPTTKFTFESKNIQHTPPDDTLEELFRHQSYMHFGLSPEMMDNATKTDFATTVEKNSVLFSRRITILSDKYAADLTDYGQKICSNDQVIQERLVEILNKYKADVEKVMDDEEKEHYQADPAGFVSYVLQTVIDLLEIDLPKPESTRSESQKTAITDQEEIIDKALQYIFSEDVLPQELGGEASNYVAALKTSWKAALMRKWMADNNYAPEAFAITNRTTDGKPMANLLEATAAYTETVMLNIDSYIKKMQEAKAASNADLEKLAPGASSGGGEPSSGSDESSGGDEDLGGSSPFDMPLAEGEPIPGEEEETPPAAGDEEPPVEPVV